MMNVIERNVSDCKYVEIFTHCPGSIGAPSGRTVFISDSYATLLPIFKESSVVAIYIY
jgi:hypothetical protein